jgi:hypothetical protein
MQVKAPRPPHADTDFAIQSIGTDLRQLGEANMRLHTGAAVLIRRYFSPHQSRYRARGKTEKLLAQWWPLLLIVVGVVLAMRPRRAS